MDRFVQQWNCNKSCVKLCGPFRDGVGAIKKADRISTNCSVLRGQSGENSTAKQNKYILQCCCFLVDV